MSLPTTVSPEQAVRYYYQLINDRQYDKTWAMLSTNFKDARHRNPDGSYDFRGYKGFWETISKIVVKDAKTEKQNDTTATVAAHLLYYTKRGSIDDRPNFRIQLVLDPVNRTWLFYDTYYE